MVHNWPFWIGLGYLCGSLPFAWWIATANGVNLRGAGSGNVGATNVGRVIGRPWGVACFVLDVLKGLIPVLTAGWVMGCIEEEAHVLPADQAWLWLGVAAAAMTGHMFPVWLGFKGGKGVATGLGVMLGLWPVMTVPVLIAAGLWAMVVKISRYVSLASMVAAGSIPVTLVVGRITSGLGVEPREPFTVVALVLATLVILRHRSNIARLMAGTESKIGVPSQPVAPGHPVKSG